MQEPSTDAGKCIPCSPYAAAKWAGAAYARMFHEVFGLPVVVVRPFMVYGPGQPAGKVIPYIIRSFMDGEQPKIGPGSQGVDWIYIDDVVRGLLETAHAKGVEGRTLDLGSGTAVPLSVVVAEIAALLPTSPRPVFGSASRPLERLKVADTETTWRLLGWRAEVSIREGLRRTVAHWRSVERARPALQSRLMAGVGANLVWLGDATKSSALSMGLM
jgi:nucleoside-diphosphate-sugar epimerase